MTTIGTIVITIICSVLGSAGVFSFITFLIKRHDDKNTEINILREEMKEEFNKAREFLTELSDKTDKNEKDNVRTQLLLLMAYYGDDMSELMRCAEHYFKDLNGNWYATPLFAKFLKERGIVKPEWLLNNN